MSTYERDTDGIRIHTSDLPLFTSGIQMTYEYIRETHHYIWVHTSGTQMAYEYIWVTYE